MLKELLFTIIASWVIFKLFSRREQTVHHYHSFKQNSSSPGDQNNGQYHSKEGVYVKQAPKSGQVKQNSDDDFAEYEEIK